MSQEIIYTSAPKGLKPGCRGFCTVVSTGGMAKNLADRLETLSGYRHQYMPHEHGENPVNYSHLRLSVGGKKYHVLSRVGDAGLDYTKRANKLAHHIALTIEETAKAPGGPAWALSQDGFLEQEWDGSVKTVPKSRKRMTSEPCPVGRCNTWESLGVDPGWAGTLAETAEKKAQPMSVIFREGADTRALVREALALLPPEKRWDGTFTTYFTKLPAGVECLWRFVLDGSPEATALRRNPHARVIDLCDPALGEAPQSELADFARTGKKTEPATRQPASSGSGIRRAASVNNSLPTDAPLLLQPSAAPVTRPAVAVVAGLELMPELAVNHSLASRRNSTLRTVALIFALVLLVAFGMVGAYIAGSKSMPFDKLPELPPPTKSLMQPAAAEIVTPEEEPDYDPLVSLSEEVKQQLDKTQAANADAERKNQEELERQSQVEDNATSTPPTETELDEEPLEHKHKPFDHILELNRMLRLPAKPISGVGVVSTPAGFKKLAKLYVHDLSQCDLELRGEEVQKQAGREVIIERNPKLGTPTDGAVTWKIIPKFSTSLSRARESGTFQLKNDTLSFQWSRDPKLDLDLCLLDISVGEQVETCSLVSPRQERPIQLDIDIEKQEINLKLRNSSTLKLDVGFEGEGFGDVELRNGSGLRRGSVAEILIPDPHGIGKHKHVKIQVEFLAAGSNGDLTLSVSGFPRFITQPAHPRQLVADLNHEQPPGEIKTQQKSQLISMNALEKWENTCKDALEKIKTARERHANLLHTLETKGRKEHQSQMDALNAGNLPESKKQELIDREKELFTQRLNDRKKEGEQLEEYEKLVLENDEWCNSMELLLKKIHDDGRINFRAYVTTEGRELNLVLSK